MRREQQRDLLDAAAENAGGVSMDEKHKPCPFCGSKSISMQYGADLKPGQYISRVRARTEKAGGA